MKKKIVSMLMVLFMAVGAMAGCSGQEKADETVQTDENEGNVEEVTLNFLVMPDIEKVKAVFDLYEEQNPHVKINLEVLPFDKMFESIEVRLGAKEDSIDVLLVDAPVIANYAAKDYITDLTSYVGEDAKQRITEESLNYCTIGDSVMALPLNSSSVNLYYNKAIFEEKGITPPENDVDKRWTWEQVVETARQLTYEKDGKQIYGLSFEQIGRPYQLLPLAQSLGAETFVNEDGLSTTGFTNSKEMVQACQFYSDTFNKWNISPKISADDAVGYFTGGQVAMFIGGPWQIPAMEEAGMDFGFAPHPYFEGGQVATPTGSWCVGVSNYSKNQEEAAKFVEFLTTNDEACALNYEIGRNLPCNLSVLDAIEHDPAYDEFPDNSMKLAVYEAKNTAMSRPQLAGYAEWQSVMESTYSDVMNGADPEEALNKAVAEIDKQLKKYQR